MGEREIRNGVGERSQDATPAPTARTDTRPPATVGPRTDFLGQKNRTVFHSDTGTNSYQ